MVVTSEESRQVQEICFANGIVWKSGSKQVWLEYKPYLFISNQYITYCDTAEFYNSKMNKEVDASVFIKTKGSCSEENQEQELEQNIKENKMKDNEVETYKDVKEYLIAKGLYERVLEIDWETYEEDTFSGLFTWSETEEKHNFWNELSKEMLDLGIEKNIESLVQDYKAKQGKEFIKHIETKPLEKPKQYLCYVQGKALPKHIHKTLEQAKQEAQRLCRKELAKVSVLEVVAEYEAEVLVKEVL